MECHASDAVVGAATKSDRVVRRELCSVVTRGT